MICVSIRCEGVEPALSAMHRARQAGADLAELRLDFFRGTDVSRLIRNRPLPVVACVRPPWEGGAFAGTEVERIALLEEACRCGAEWVDVEFRASHAFPRHGARVLLSFHETERMPEDLESMVRKMRGLEPDLLKVAVPARGTRDVLRLIRLQRSVEGASVFVPMGPYGEPARILYRRLGSFLTYAAPEAGQETAPGQLPVEDLVRLYRIKSHEETTRIFGVVGDPVSRSQGPRVFNAVFPHLGLNACYVRFPLDEAALLPEVLEEFGVEGASVTLPHKEAVLPLLPEAGETARAVGAVNTIVRRDGRLRGENTDAEAAVEAIQEAARGKWSHGVYGLRALVVGAGGAARAIAWGLQGEGCRVTIANRTWERAQKLADDLGCEAVPLREIARVRPQILVHATPVGMEPDTEGMPPVEEALAKDQLVFDAVYVPRDTRLLREARSRGASVVDGVDFYLRQADRQCRIWLGRGIPTELMKEFQRTM